MKCIVKRGIKIGEEYHRPGDWMTDFKENEIEVDARNKEVKHYLRLGYLQQVYEEESEEDGHTQSD